MEQNITKELPYGIQDFVQVIEQGFYYVDKTMFIPNLEEGYGNLFCIRPRRFGKSMFLSMLQAYYDCRTKDKFQEWFGDLWIGKHPTAAQGKYQVLYLDFSQMRCTIENLEKKFNECCCAALDDFMDKYGEYYPEATKKQFYDCDDAGGKLIVMTLQARSLHYPLYLIVDEYDSFVNTLLNEQGEKMSWAIYQADRLYCDFFKKVKGAFERTLFTGVTPVALDGVVTANNVAWNIAGHDKYYEMLGFSTEDISSMLTYYKNKGKISADTDIEAVLRNMELWGGNYCLSQDALESQRRVFNCDMAIDYLCHYIENGEVSKQMLTSKYEEDFCNVKKLLRLDGADGYRKDVLRTIRERGEIKALIENVFSPQDITNPDMFASFLLYYGLLTIEGTKGCRLTLGIPNDCVRKMYNETFAEYCNNEKV